MGNTCKTATKKMPEPTIVIGKDADEVSSKLCGLIDREAQAFFSSANEGPFVIGLSGGSLPKFFAKGIESIKVDWTKVKFIFCDERLVPFDNDDSTFKVYREQLIGKVDGITEDNFVLVNPDLPAPQAADDYAEKLLKVSAGPLPRFHILLLGMGPDGHTCSLFPGHVLLDERKMLVAPITDSPKPPPQRVTLTYPVINNAKMCIFVCTGAGKVQMVEDILKHKKDFPATRVMPNNGELVWILDAPAAANL